VFRDNFDTIKRSLQSAQEEITDLQSNTAKLNLTNDFEKNTITRAVFQNCRDQKFDGGILDINLTVDFENGPYQIFRFSEPVNIDFLNLPGDPQLTDETTPIGIGKITLELYGDGGEPVTAGSFVVGRIYTITALGDTENEQWNTIAGTTGVTYNVNDVFTASSAGVGTGAAQEHRLLNFVTTGGTVYKKDSSFPAAVSVLSSVNPIFIEVWRHSSAVIFMRYLGQYS
jgi:hypothetical protein